VKVPVSLHHQGDAVANRDSSFSLGLPISEADPVARLRLVHARTNARKQADDAERRELLLERLSGVSLRLERFAKQLERSPRRFPLNVSNVPGPHQPVTVMGAGLRRLCSLAEIAERHALRVSVVSLADQLGFGFCADADLVPDVQAMAARVEAEALTLLDAVEYRERSPGASTSETKVRLTARRRGCRVAARRRTQPGVLGKSARALSTGLTAPTARRALIPSAARRQPGSRATSTAGNFSRARACWAPRPASTPRSRTPTRARRSSRASRPRA
jgi:hypothetical protein